MRQPTFLLFLPFLLSVLPAQTPEFDVLISGGRIVDGAGNPWYPADIGVRGGRIVAIGRLPDSPARLRIDAKNLVVTPGFIDIHSHGRGGILEVPSAENYIRQGVTTIIDGNDGGSPVPLGPFLDKVAGTPVTMNFGSFVGQGSVRREVLGLENRRATAEEIQKMKELTRLAMREGAFGLSTGLFYVPGNYTPTEEVIELAKVAGELGGIHISHMRDEAAGVLDSVRETIRIGEEGGLPTQITHHKVLGVANLGRSRETLQLVAEARARGVDVTIDQYPYTASSTGTAALFPQWAQAGGRTALLERLAAPEQRARIKREIVIRIRDDRGGGDPKNVVLVSCEFDPSLAGQNLAQVTAARGRAVTLENAAETAMELQEKGGCSAVYHAMIEEDVKRIMGSPFTMISSDGGIPIFGRDVPHPRNYGAFARILGRYVRQEGVLTLEDAIRRMSSFPAARLGLHDRGILRPGFKADIAVLDPATVIDKAEFLKPHQYAEGVRHVLVNGKPVLVDGRLTGEKPGEVLRGPAWRRP